MVFSRFFKQERPADAAAADSREPEGSEGEPEGMAPEEHDELSWLDRARDVLPTGSSTGSKRFGAIWGADDAEAPSHYIRASGCRVTTVDGAELIDCTMALGSVALGYADERITSAVVAALSTGTVSGLPHAIEVEVAERFCEAVPCAERVQFLKTGAEAVAATIRLARAHTGRTRVVGCGYFGWLDWSAGDPGVPAAVQADFVRVPFNDIPALERAVADAGSALAAIVIEPFVEALADEAWARRARELATAAGACLVFDEVKTGFRLATGGYQELSGITPDLAAFGKALANGLPLAAFCGRADIMAHTRSTWISSTLAGETTALAAARAVLMLYAEQDIPGRLAASGAALREAVGNAVRASRVRGISVHGIDPMWFLKFDSPELESQFLVAAAANGVLFKRGPYNFAALAHDEATIHEIESCTSNALVALRDAGAA